MTLTCLKYLEDIFQLDPSLISEESAYETSLSMADADVFGKLSYTVAQFDFGLECVQEIFQDSRTGKGSGK